MEKCWHITVADGTQRGPFSEDEVVELIRSGQLEAGSQCLRDDLDDWTPITEVAVFASALEHAKASPGPGAGDGWEALKGVLERGKRGALRKMEEAKLKLRIGKLNRTREQLYTALGAEVYRQRDSLSLTDTMAAKVDSIAKCDGEIEKVKQEIENIGQE